MSEPTPAPQPAETQPVELGTSIPPTEPSKAHGNPVGNLISRMTLTQLTLVVLVVIFVWQWVAARGELNQMQIEVARRLAEVDGTNKANQTLVTQNQELVRELGGKLSVLESNFAESQNQRAALETLYQEMSSSRDQTALADVEQMLLIAGQQLQLSANVKAALIAMQHADNRLQRLNRPVFSDLRKHITQDIDRLRALPSIDVPGINQQLDTLILAADELPLIQDIQPQQKTTATPATSTTHGTLNSFWNELWQELRQLVRIENTQQEVMPLLPPNQAFFLRENLKMRLLSARLALLSHDEVSFQRELKTAQAWTKRYFEAKSSQSVQVLSTLQKLSDANIAINVPDISGSLEAVRNFRATHERGAQ